MKEVSVKEEKESKKQDLNMKEAMPLFAFLVVCLTILLVALVYTGVMSVEHFFTFVAPTKIVISIIISTIGLILFGIFLTKITPAEFIDDTNKSYQNDSLLNILSFMLLVVLFEELLFRGVIQNLLLLFTGHHWVAILATTVLFMLFHTNYYKKPIMMIYVAFPSFIFCWTYFFTSNILTPIMIHFLMNVVITLLFKYQLIMLKQ